MADATPQNSELHYRRLFESARDGILILDGETGAIVDANPFMTESLGYSRDELLGKMLWQIGAFVDVEASKQAFTELAARGYVRYENLRLKRKDGTLLDVEFVSNAYDVGGERVYQCNIRDISERVKVEQALSQSEQYLHALIDNVSDIILVVGLDGVIRFASKAVRWLGYRPEDVIGRPFQNFLHPDDLPQAVWRIEEITRDPGQVLRDEYRIRSKTGAWHDVELLTRNLAAVPAVRGLVTVIRDITEHKRAEADLRLFRELIDQSNDAIEVVDPVTMQYLDCNQKACRDLGYRREELLTLTVFQTDPKVNRAMLDELEERLRQSDTATFESVHRRKDGSTFSVEINLKRIILDRPRYVVIVRDLTEQKQRERALAKVNRALKTLSAGNAALVHADTENEIYRRMCAAAVEIGGYRLAWVGIAEDDQGRTVRVAAHAGEGGSYLESAAISWADTERGRGPTGSCVRTGQVQVVQNIGETPHMSPWLAGARQVGIQSRIALPLKGSAGVFGALVVDAVEADAFDGDERLLLADLANNLAYGVTAIRNRAAQIAGLQHLERGMEATVYALAGTVELRDPYTAGHQRRVALLSVEIAKALGLSADRLRGLNLAATIHDIGKLSIPSEILSKPGMLMPLERELVQTHAEAGYSILRGVDFPWPVAEIVRQHHERLDGSGYPRGLEGEEILLEARIVTVADVVEAMSSHRPYRAGKGLDAALEEITRSRGKTLDADVVDACLKLFREQGFSFDS